MENRKDPIAWTLQSKHIILHLSLSRSSCWYFSPKRMYWNAPHLWKSKNGGTWIVGILMVWLCRSIRHNKVLGRLFGLSQTAGQEVYIDVAFTGVFNKTNLARNLGIDNHTLAKVEDRKEKIYKSCLNYDEGRIVLVAIDSCGAMGTTGKTYMDECLQSFQMDRRVSTRRWHSGLGMESCTSEPLLGDLQGKSLIH
jgi:hypothetical protein